eukprot:CAMPEP_0113629762 /NCGR_PEP_ID=MMETSP0017_2-20120614/15456_1 /TAXON_ID=2856 /ORGANISM="Cylindrotheca closterium" /LENGTH=434 /DNA_ID=CAMNT_0000540185 /DNA_START=48 /DNA_END=1352 /DNA_ORIENTATION=+ /assembly_acc=CAM_ASM_000147
MGISRFLAFAIYAHCLSFTWSFSFQNPVSTAGGLVCVEENVERDVYSMMEWAFNACGVQKADGFQLTSNDGQDYEVYTEQDMPEGSPILFVPNEVIFASYKAVEEFGQILVEAENNGPLSPSQRPLFRVFVKILVEYEKGQSSPWYPWLNSTPRLYNTGAAMTNACFECLPPYAAQLALADRQNFINFQQTINLVAGSNLISQETLSNVKVLKWAYSAAVTRSTEWNGERLIAPMADMFNHGTETEAEISYDETGNCYVYASKNVPAGSPLRISLGDPTDPSKLFATYGFLDESSPTVFCKAVHLENEMEELGYKKSDLLFSKETGEISMKVYDVQLYAILQENDPDLAEEFFQAVMSSDEATKSQFHQQYWQYTKEALEEHVDGLLFDLEELSAKAMSYDTNTHPRVPVILQHNEFVKETFWKVKQNLLRSVL